MPIALFLALVPIAASAEEPRSEADWMQWAADRLEAFARTGDQPEPGEPPCYPKDPKRVHAMRRLTLYSDAADTVREVYVAGGVATIIRLPSKLATRGTRIAPGGERRFDVLMGGKQVLLIPTRQLAKGERFPMVVALADGTVIPLSLTRAPEGSGPDGELWLDREQAKPEDLRIRLASMTAKARGFEVSLQKALKEQESEDFQLAGLMAAHQRLTAFHQARAREFLASADRRVRLTTYAPRPDAADATSKVVAVFDVTNDGPEPLDLSSGSALRNPGSDFVPLALRALPGVIPPGGGGRIAVVLDRASFGPDGTITLTLFDKPLNVGIQLSAELALEDFTVRPPLPPPPPPASPPKWSTWWPF